MSKVLIVETPYKNNRGEWVRHLVIDDYIWMSNEWDEYKDIDRALKTAKGNCYIGGLGMGLITEECKKKPEVKNIIVVDSNIDVIEYVCKYLKYKELEKGHWTDEEKVDVFLADARKDFVFFNNKNKKISKYDWIYTDIYIEPDEHGSKDYFDCKKGAEPFLKKNGVFDGWLSERIENEN